MVIDLKTAISMLECGEWVKLRFIKADLAKKEAGEVVEIKRCRIARNHSSATEPQQQKESIASSRSANHNKNFTRNVQLPNKQYRKVHPLLITHVNDIPVV